MTLSPQVGDTLPVRFVNTELPECSAVVERCDGKVLGIRYLDGVFAGLRGVLRLPGWTKE